MSVFSAICDAWRSELQSTVTGLDTSTIPIERVHLYAPWATEQMAALAGERHLAIWPEGEPELVEAYIAASPPADLATQSYIISVWEDASAESTRRFDDDTANLAWLTLFEAIRARLYVMANTALGDAGSSARYDGGTFGLEGTTRVLVIRFKVRRVQTFT